MDVYIYDPGAPTADAGPDQSLCTPDTTTNLAGNVPSFPGEGTWTLIGGSGTIADPNDAGTFVSGLSVGENVFVWEMQWHLRFRSAQSRHRHRHCLR